MGIFSRISDIVNANVNAMLDKAEDPEKMVKLMINEMEDTLIEVKSAAAEVVADRIRLQRMMKVENERSVDWDGKAALAIEKGREDLAREALERRMASEKQVTVYENRLAEVDGLAKQYQEDISRLEEKLESARVRQRTLIANHKSALNRRNVEEKIYRMETSGAFARFDTYEKRIDRFQAEAEILHQSNSTLDKKFQDLEHEQSVEDELAKLKARVGDSGTGKIKVEAV